MPSVLKVGSGYWLLGAPVAAERMLYRFQLTLPADGDDLPCISPLFLSNPGAGFARALTIAGRADYAKWPDLPIEEAQ